MKKLATINASQITTLGPQKPFWICALLSFELFTPTNSIAITKWNSPRAKLTRWTAAKPKQACPPQSMVT